MAGTGGALTCPLDEFNSTAARFEMGPRRLLGYRRILTAAVIYPAWRLIVARSWVERAWPAPQPRPVQALIILSSAALPAIALTRSSQ